MTTPVEYPPTEEPRSVPADYTKKIYRLLVGIVISIVLCSVAGVGVYAFWQYQLVEAPKLAQEAEDRAIEAQDKADIYRASQTIYKNGLSTWNECIAYAKVHDGESWTYDNDPRGDRVSIAGCGIRPTPPLIGADGTVIYPKYEVTFKSRKYFSSEAWKARTQIIQDAINASEAEIEAAAADGDNQVDWNSVVVKVIK
ncbi:MAG TPA: hypothetical protein VII49_12955 [Rhizomicrobium sp.]